MCAAFPNRIQVITISETHTPPITLKYPRVGKYEYIALIILVLFLFLIQQLQYREVALFYLNRH